MAYHLTDPFDIRRPLFFPLGRRVFYRRGFELGVRLTDSSEGRQGDE